MIFLCDFLCLLTAAVGDFNLRLIDVLNEIIHRILTNLSHSEQEDILLRDILLMVQNIMHRRIRDRCCTI